MSACSNCCGELWQNATVDDIIEDDLDDCNADGSDFERNISYIYLIEFLWDVALEYFGIYYISVPCLYLCKGTYVT